MGTTTESASNDYCHLCSEDHESDPVTLTASPESLATTYPKYYKDVAHLDEIDVYTVHHLFQIIDPAGAIQHASKKLLLSGVRTGGKSKFHDIKEARDTLTRWLQLNPEE
jgi:hypothetical protein